MTRPHLSNGSNLPCSGGPLEFGGFAEEGLVGAGEGGIVFEAAVVANLGDGGVAGEQFSGKEQAFAVDIVADGAAGLLLELAHHVVFTDVKCLRQGVNVQVRGQMGAYVVHDCQNLLV